MKRSKRWKPKFKKRWQTLRPRKRTSRLASPSARKSKRKAASVVEINNISFVDEISVPHGQRVGKLPLLYVPFLVGVLN